MTDALPDGVYFGLPPAIYHAQPRVGSTSISDLLVSPGLFWQNSWRNPARPAPDDGTPAAILGTAYHTALLQPELFEAAYARRPTLAEHPGALASDGEIRFHLERLGRSKSKAGEKVADRARRLRRAGFQGEIFPLLQAEFEAENQGRIALDAGTYDAVLERADRLNAQPEIAEALAGWREVSIFWTHPSGVAMRARPDVLRIGEGGATIADPKTLECRRGRPWVEQCFRAFRFEAHYRQAVMAMLALDAVAAGDVPPAPPPYAPPPDWRAEGAAVTRAVMVYISRNTPDSYVGEIQLRGPITGAQYQDSGATRVAPWMTQPSGLVRRGLGEIESALRIYASAAEVFGDAAPWSAVLNIGRIEDSDFPPLFTEGW